MIIKAGVKSAWGVDEALVWHMVQGFGLTTPCGSAASVVAVGFPPRGALFCPTCLRAIPSDVRAWLLERELRYSGDFP